MSRKEARVTAEDLSLRAGAPVATCRKAGQLVTAKREWASEAAESAKEAAESGIASSRISIRSSSRETAHVLSYVGMSLDP